MRDVFPGTNESLDSLFINAVEILPEEDLEILAGLVDVLESRQ
jgi:hypothetical protein